MSDVYIFGVAWEEIVNWFVAQPLYGQILVLIGLFAVIALAVVIVYFVLKGVVYLVYYILKGVYYLLKGIGLLFYKLCEGLYYAISGKPKPESATEQEQQVIASGPQNGSLLIVGGNLSSPDMYAKFSEKP